MDALTGTTVWWACTDCGIDVELAGVDGGVAVPCPDCPGELAEQWRWDAAA
ncbi:hypothetical protein I4I84_22200 [Pseudonocardia sp. KRD-182]|uniref:hypothetical protein n=1 Tax=Pseudonocardia oceani TaxID=2792013 RepID=UPI001C4A54B9|nr:hypothetical protein [Pseudonocardia oceani]MBW0111427.1 hypothetical protein [Pseudonocardia oceani]